MNWNPYLQSICDTYSEWWSFYTLTDVVGKQRDGQKKRTHLLGLMVEKVKQEQEEKTERLTVLDGLRKYADSHVLLIGRPGSGKSTALARLLLESAQTHLEINFQANRESRLKTTESPAHSPFQRTSAMSQGIDSLADSVNNAAIPVLVELRYYQTSILDLIRDFLKRHHILLSNCEIEQLLFDGQFLLLVDGVNELPSEAARGDLQKFRQDYRNTTPMVFTTRDLGVGGDLGIEQKLQMQPLTEEQMWEFVCGYLPEQGEEMLKQLSGRLRELGETPLLLWMLCSVFVDNQNQVPANLGSVFRRFTEIYNNKLKQDIPVSDESRRWWRRLLQHLAWVMMQGGTSPTDCRDAKLPPFGRSYANAVSTGGLALSTTEILVAIPKQQARDILTQFLKEQDYHQPRDAEVWLDDLLKHHLIQVGTDNQIEFRHQLLQEYYAAERLLLELPNLSDEQLQWDYLNYLKWTEPVALMMQLVDKQSQAVGLVKLALAVDWQLGARLAGEVKEKYQEETVQLITDLNLPQFLEVRLLRISTSEAAIPRLITLLEHQDSDVREGAAYALGESKSEAAIPGLIKLLEHEDSNVRDSAASVLRGIKSEAAVSALIQFPEHEDSDMGYSYEYALGRIKSKAAATKLIQLLEHKIKRQNSFASFRVENAWKTIKKRKSKAARGNLIKLRSDVSVPWKTIKKRKSKAARDNLIKLLPDVSVSTLIKIILMYKNSRVLRLAASTLGKIKFKAAISRLIKLLEDEDSRVRILAASALGKIKSKAAIPELIKLLEDEDSNVRYSAASALGKIKSKAAIPELIKLLEDEESNVPYAAVYALGEIKSEAAVPGLIKVLEHEDSYMRSSAAYALVEMKSEAAILGLIKLLNTKNFIKLNNGDNAFQAIDALEKIQKHLKYYKPIPKPTMSKSTSHNYALLIGVGECEENKLSLPVTVKDIQALKTLLTDSNLCGYIDANIHLLHDKNATKSAILDSLNWLKQQAENDPEATILVFYSGHGFLHQSGDYYLIPHETDRTDIPETALPAQIFNQALREIPAQRLLVIIDSCHAQGMATSKDDTGNNKRSPIPKGFTQTALPKTIIDDLKQGTGRVVFTSSTGEQLSWIRRDDTMSIYTYHFLEALQGAANQPGDKVVKVSHLMNYLSQTVPATTQQEYKKEQTPFFDFATEDFPVALLRGGKGLPPQGWEEVKGQAQEKIRGISVNGNNNITGDRNISVKIDNARDISFGGLSSD